MILISKELKMPQYVKLKQNIYNITNTHNTCQGHYAGLNLYQLTKL